MSTSSFQGRRDGDPTSDNETLDQSASIRSVQSKFLEVVKTYAGEKYLELLVDLETPNAGYGYIQKKESFSNLYSFHFEFSSESATFYLGTEKVAKAGPEQRRDVQFSGGDQREEVLTEIRAGIDSASKVVFPGLGALSSPRDTPAAGTLSSLKSPSTPAVAACDGTTDRRDAATVWGQDEKGTRTEVRAALRRRSRIRSLAPGLILLGVLFLVFVPVFQSSVSCTTCSTASGAPIAPSNLLTAYSSITYHFFGTGGAYFPPDHGFLANGYFGTGAGVNGTRTYGFAAWGYYFVA